MSQYNDTLTEQFEMIGTLLNDQMSSFVTKDQLDKLAAVKGIFTFSEKSVAIAQKRPGVTRDSRAL